LRASPIEVGVSERVATRRRVVTGLGTALTVGFAGCSDGTGPVDTDSPTASPSVDGTPIHAGYETTRVRVETPAGTRLGAVTAAIADTPSLRYTGLSDTESLPENRGMLFVYDGVSDHTFVMRRMDFGLDIVYADADGTITVVHHAPAPGPDEDGSDRKYPGRGQYVLEVNRGWTTERGVTAGDRLVFD
jgi:uncharacterized membrane protein (UPF0127 family)